MGFNSGFKGLISVDYRLGHDNTAKQIHREFFF